MSAAINEARRRSDDIDDANPHANASMQNDKAETLAMGKVFGNHAGQLCASSAKFNLGQSLGARAGVAFLAGILMSDRQDIHPALNLTSQDPQCDLDLVANVSRAMSVPTIEKLSSGFWGCNAASVLGQGEHG